MPSRLTSGTITFVLVVLGILLVLLVWSMPDAKRAIGTGIGGMVQQKKPLYSTEQIEKLLFESMNKERESRGIPALLWDDMLAKVARNHSAYLAELNTGLKREINLTHKGEDGLLVDSRLRKAGIYYWHMTNENLHAASSVRRFSRIFPDTPTAYYRMEEVADAIADGWRNNSEDLENVLNTDYDQSGIGVAVDSSGLNYVATQVFIKKAECGYPSRSCCVEQGYLPYCFEPFECSGMECVEKED